jgi:DNA-binding MarR family transcriptional regulator
VRRRPDPRDGRATLVETTPASAGLRAQVEELWAELEAATVGDMPSGRRRDLLAGLEQLEANLADAPDSAPER